MLSATAVAAALCSVAVAASTASFLPPPGGFDQHGRLATIGGLAWPAGQEQAAVTGDDLIYVAAAPGPRSAPGAVQVRRYLSDGEPDRSFGLGGALIFDELGGGFRLDELLTDTNGSPYLVGTTADRELVVARLGPQGALDPTYGDGGVTRLGSLPAGADRPRATIDQGNRVIVAAAGVVDRLSPSGALDPTFGSNGSVPLPTAGVEGLGVDEEGRIQLALPGADGKGFRLIRLGQDGRASVRTYRGVGAARAMAVRSNGSTLIVGTAAKRAGDGVTVPLVSIRSAGDGGTGHRYFVRLRGPAHANVALLYANGDDYLIGAREIVDLETRPNLPFSPGDALDFFGRNGRATIGSPGRLIAGGASITDSDGTILVDGIERPRPGSAAHGFLARIPAGEHVITYAPEPVGG